MTISETKKYWILFTLAATTFAITLGNVQYTGEEAVYPLMSYEMWYNGHILTPVMYGQGYWRPPLDNWLITAVSELIGWSHMLVAARLIAALATVGSGLLVGWFAGRVWDKKGFGAFAALVYITLGDVLFYDGWLAYSDPLFAFFCLAAMLLGWLAVVERRYGFLAAAIMAVSCAFLTKAMTAYVFYGVALLIVAYRTRAWRFFLSWPSWIIHLLGLAVPVLWYSLAPAGGTMAHGMLDDILDKLRGQGLLDYLHQFFIFPMQTLGQLLPIAGVLIYGAIRHHTLFRTKDPQALTALWIAGVNYLPYWLSPQSGTRYLMPIYGIIALVLAAIAFNGEKTRRLVVAWLLAAIFLKYIFSLYGFPIYTQDFRPNIKAISDNIINKVHGKALYINNVSWVGISIAADIDLAIAPLAPLVLPPPNLGNGFVISYPGAIPSGYKVTEKYQGAWLLCHGTACKEE